MENRRVRSQQFLCQKWTLFAISSVILLSCVILAALSNRIADNYCIHYETQSKSEYKKEALEQALIGMALVTGFFSMFGIIGAFKEHYCSSLTFAIYMTLNTVANLYVALQASGIWMYAIIDLCIAVIAFSFAKQLRAQRLLRSTSSTFFITQPYNHQSIAVPIPDSGQHWVTCTASANQQWFPVQPPPPYTQEYSEYPNSKQYMQ